MCCLASAALPLGAHAAPRATSAVPCWKRLLNDWYDGTINNRYPIPCYQQAIKHLPPEISIYGSAKDDIQRAEQAAINHRSAPPEGGGGNGTTTTGGSGAGNQTPPSGGADRWLIAACSARWMSSLALP